jgi:hypothetical protein
MAFNNSLHRNVGTSEQIIYTSAANGVVVIGLRISNTTASTIKACAYIKRSSTNYYLVGGATPATMGADVPVGSAIVVINGDIDKVVLNNGDQLCVISNTATSCDAIAAYLE